jgi:nucleoside-diphosphate-sugar epimerase
VIDACLKHGVKKLVHVSSLSVLDHAGHVRGETVTESSALEPKWKLPDGQCVPNWCRFLSSA